MVRFDDLVLPEALETKLGRFDPDTVDVLETLAQEVREEQAELADARNMSRRQFMGATCLASLAAPVALQSARAGEGDGTIPKKNKIDSPATQQASGLDYARLFKPLKELNPNYAPADALGIIRFGYGTRRGYHPQARPTPHKGLDIEAAKGTDVLAVARGYGYYEKKYNGGLQNIVYHTQKLRIPEVDMFFELATNYAHLSKTELFARSETSKRRKMIVLQGMKIGEVGNSGRIYTGTSHLHYEVIVREPRGKEQSNKPWHTLNPAFFWTDLGKARCYGPDFPARGNQEILSGEQRIHFSYPLPCMG